MTKLIRVFSQGAGTQSVATLILQKQGRIAPFDIHIFANTGDDSENPKTLAYVRDILMPYAEEHGIDFRITQLTNRQGKPITLRGDLMDQSKRSIPIPVYSDGRAPGVRACTVNWKIRPIHKAIKTLKPTHVEMGIGFSIDEARRAENKPTDWVDRTEKNRPLGYLQRYVFPLLDLGLTRNDCVSIIRDEGLPQPGKSACTFCTYNKIREWNEMRLKDPDQFAKEVELERVINAKHQAAGRDGYLYLHRRYQPLDQAVGLQPSLFEEVIEDDAACQEHCGI